MTSHYWIWKNNMGKHGVLPVPVCRNRGIFKPGSHLWKAHAHAHAQNLTQTQEKGKSLRFHNHSVPVFCWISSFPSMLYRKRSQQRWRLFRTIPGTPLFWVSQKHSGCQIHRRLGSVFNACRPYFIFNRSQWSRRRLIFKLERFFKRTQRMWNWRDHISKRRWVY